MVYTDSISGSGAVTCSNTGGLYKYTSCYLMNPLTVTGVVMRLDLQMYNSPNAANAYCVSTTVGSTTATGVVFFRNRATWTGAVLVNSTGSIAVAPHAGIRCWFSKTPGTVKANLRVWMTDFYVP